MPQRFEFKGDVSTSSILGTAHIHVNWRYNFRAIHPKYLFLWKGCRKISILPQNSPFGGASVVQKGKRKMQVSENQALAFCLVPGAAVEIINLTKIILN